MARRWTVLQRVALAGLLAVATIPAGAASKRQPPPPPPPKKGPIEYLESLLPWTDVGPEPDFVRESRPAVEGGFIPVGAEPGEQTLSVKSAAQLAAAKADLEQAKTMHETVRAHPPTLGAAAVPPPAANPAPATDAATKPTAAKSSRTKPGTTKPGTTKSDTTSSASAKTSSKRRAKRKPPPDAPGAE